MKGRNPSALLGVALVLAGVPGCSGPELVWYGHTPDRAARVELRRDGDGEWLAVGERTTSRYERISTESITFGPGGRWAFAAIRAGDGGQKAWRVVTDSGESPALAGVGGLRFSRSGMLVYGAQLGRRWTVVRDGRFSAPMDALGEGSIAFSPDGRRVSYVRIDGDCERLVIDGKPGACEAAIVAARLGDRPSADAFVARSRGEPDVRVVVGGSERGRFLDARELEIDASGEHWAVVASTRGSPGWKVVCDGAAGRTFDEIRDVEWAPDGHEIAYAARRGRTWFVVHGEAMSRPYLRVEAPTYSEDGRLAFIGRTAEESEIVVDGDVVWRAKTEATALCFDPRGGEIAWTYRGPRGAILAVGRRRFAFDVIVEGSLRFSADGRHWAVLAGDRSDRSLFIVVDGARKLPFDTTELFGGGLRNTDAPIDGIGDWVEAELRRYLASRSRA